MDGSIPIEKETTWVVIRTDREGNRAEVGGTRRTWRPDCERIAAGLSGRIGTASSTYTVEEATTSWPPQVTTPVDTAERLS